MVRFGPRNVHWCRLLRYQLSNGLRCSNESGHAWSLFLNRCYVLRKGKWSRGPEDMRSELNCIWNWFIFLCHTYFRVKTKSKTAQECFKIFQSSSMTIKREKKYLSRTATINNHNQNQPHIQQLSYKKFSIDIFHFLMVHRFFLASFAFLVLV